MSKPKRTHRRMNAVIEINVPLHVSGLDIERELTDILENSSNFEVEIESILVEDDVSSE